VEERNAPILIAPLNWGLGHATRCIPIIRALLLHGFTPIIASDGMSLDLLRKEFPTLQTLELPSYQIEYPKNGTFFKLKMIQNVPKMLRAIGEEKKLVAKWIDQYEIQGIISDNRLGVFSKKVPCVYLTHQLNVLTGNTSKISSRLHHYFMKKYNECWIPDVNRVPNLSGRLGHLKETKLKLKYIGPLSRLHKKVVPKKYDLMIMLTGPEPQRSILENQLQNEVSLFDGKVLFIRGIIESEQKITKIGNIAYYNFMNSFEIEQAFNESELVLCRSGYSTIMDLVCLEKKAFFIPTPGQFEQEYLAKKLKRNGMAPFAKQEKFKMVKLQEIQLYKGFESINTLVDWQNLFSVFRAD